MEKNMKETFDIKYRPEIESGKYRVVTRRGEPVEILKWDAKGGDFPIVGLVTLIETDTQEPYSFMTDGRFDPNAVIDDLDLFVTNEPELTKFEKDLALTWEDVQLLDFYAMECQVEESKGRKFNSSQEFFEEVLRRFKKAKEE